MKHKEFIEEIQKNKPIYFQSWLPENKMIAQIILIHGLGEHSTRYSSSFTAFYTRNNIGISTFDLPGHGKSYGKRGHIDDPLYIIEILDHSINKSREEFPSLPVFIYGHSFGGEISLWYSLIHNNDATGYIHTSPLIGPKDKVPAFKLFLAKLMDKIMPSFSLDNGIATEKLSRDNNIVSSYVNDPYVHRQISAKAGMMIINRGKWILENAKENTHPTLLMLGDKEGIVNLDAIIEFSKSAPNVTFKVWPNLYHELHNEPEKLEVYKYTLQWIRENLNA